MSFMLHLILYILFYQPKASWAASTTFSPTTGTPTTFTNTTLAPFGVPTTATSASSLSPTTLMPTFSPTELTTATPTITTNPAMAPFGASTPEPISLTTSPSSLSPTPLLVPSNDPTFAPLSLNTSQASNEHTTIFKVPTEIQCNQTKKSAYDDEQTLFHFELSTAQNVTITALLVNVDNVDGSVSLSVLRGNQTLKQKTGDQEGVILAFRLEADTYNVILEGESLHGTYTLMIDCISEVTKQHDQELEAKQESLENVFEGILITVIIIFVVIGISGTIDARFLRINDFYRIGAISTSLLQILDMLSDCFLAIDVSIQNKIDPDEYSIILYVCIACIVVPSLLSLFQVYYYSSRIWSTDNKIREWLLKYSKLLYISSLLTGSSFTAVEIMNSNIFGLQYFEMNLSHRQLISFKTQRIYSVVMIENIPQLALQVWYLIKLKDTSNIIAISSIIFSAISIIVTVLSMTMEKSLINSQQYTLFTLDVTGNSVATKAKQCKKRVRKIKQGISTIIGLDYGLIETVKPRTIPKGLRLECYLYVNNEESKENNYAELLNTAKDDGSLAHCIYKAWHLSNVPNISNIKCQEMESINTMNRLMSESTQNTMINMVDDVTTTSKPAINAMRAVSSMSAHAEHMDIESQ